MHSSEEETKKRRERESVQEMEDIEGGMYVDGRS